MEQARYWMWTKQNNNHDHQSIQSSSKNSPYYDSWEEQAFAEDAAAGSLGGCIWPPRSYSCSFCRREFRSAQALGGHMNVHRRDRARLKVQSPTTTTPNENLHDQEHQQTHLNQIRNPFLSSIYSSHAFPVGNPNPDCNPAFLHQSSCLPCSHVPENRSPFWSKLVSGRNQFITDLTSEEDIVRSEPAGHRAKEGCMKTDLSSVSLSLVLPSKNTNLSAMPGTMEMAAAGCKRRRGEESSQVSFAKLRSTLAGRNSHVQSELLKLCPSSSEDLDLELRLGDRPKVK